MNPTKPTAAAMRSAKKIRHAYGVPSLDNLDERQIALLIDSEFAEVVWAAKYIQAALQPIPDIELLEGGICAACGAWTPKGNPEAHDHEENCTAVRTRSALIGQRHHNERHGKRILDQALAKLKE